MIPDRGDAVLHKVIAADAAVAAGELVAIIKWAQNRLRAGTSVLESVGPP